MVKNKGSLNNTHVHSDTKSKNVTPLEKEIQIAWGLSSNMFHGLCDQ